MPDSPFIENDFLKKITEITEANISNEQFGVSELASETGMSRSNLLRKIKKLTGLSASQFIRQVRLQRAMEMLNQASYNVSEISYKVGFNSTSYFIKCFHDHYGYPPGEVGKREVEENDSHPIDQPSQSHQLAAIMFTDIQGYTALMQRDEEKAIEFRNRHREVFNKATKKFNGKILQYYGDGTLSTFSSAIDAVKCAIEMQLAYMETPRIPVRIGIHSGDIIVTKDEIIGDGVNVASRIESLAEAGSIFISEKVYDEVKNQTGIQTASLGVFELKNVDKPMEVFAITNMGLVAPERDLTASKGRSGSRSDSEELMVKGKRNRISWAIAILAVIFAAYLIFSVDIFKIATELFTSSNQKITKKSIAVLPFIDDSNDSSNVYIINGLMESILNNLQKIEDLRVISRTSVEKYRNSSKLIPEIAQELNVDYFVEGSGQKIGDQILLNVQLIEASTDEHLWAEQFNREATDIFNLQKEVAKTIADKIEAVITPEEEERINKPPTDNLVAYDYFLKGLDLLYKGNSESLEESIIYFKKAIEHDNEFARAYADIAIAYYYLDIYQKEKQYANDMNEHADKALFYDSKLPQSLVAKGLFYIHEAAYDLAVPYLEKALYYNPNSAFTLNTLSDLYANYIPNTEKYLQYALKGISLDIAAHDSTTASFVYLHVSNAFIQSGFVEEAEEYINKSLEYHPGNIYSAYVRAYILFSKNRDLQKLKMHLLKTLAKDSSRLDVLQEVGKVYYYLRDYDSAYRYYKKYYGIRQALYLDIYKAENAKIGVVYSKVGLEEESEKFFADYLDYAENDKSIYRHLSLAVYYSWIGEVNKSIEELRLFSQEENYHYWILLFLEMDPLIDHIKDQPAFRKLMRKIESKFWDKQKQIEETLDEEGLI